MEPGEPGNDIAELDWVLKSNDRGGGRRQSWYGEKTLRQWIVALEVQDCPQPEPVELGECCMWIVSVDRAQSTVLNTLKPLVCRTNGNLAEHPNTPKISFHPSATPSVDCSAGLDCGRSGGRAASRDRCGLDQVSRGRI